ncbi:MAG: hypothetical protein ACM3XM_17840 [Mycobacterium leprae]
MRILINLMTVLFLVLSAQSTFAQVATRDCIPLVLLAKADFDGDGKQDQLLGATTSSEGAYRSLIVESAEGKKLLDITDAGYYYRVRVADIGAPNPIVIAGTRFGNKWEELQAWMFLPNRGFQQLWWNSSFTLVGRLVSIAPKTIQVDTEAGPKVYQYVDGSLQSTD